MLVDWLACPQRTYTVVTSCSVQFTKLCKKGASGTEQRQSLVLRLPEELMFGLGLRKGRGKGENEPSERMVGGQ